MMVWLQSIFTNQSRGIKLLTGTASILLLCLYAVLTAPNIDTSINDISKTPTAHLDQITSFGGTIKEKDGVFILQDRGMEIPVKNLPETTLDQTVTGKALIQLNYQGPYFWVTEYHVHEGRTIKIITGPIVLLVLLVWFLRLYKIDLKTYQFIQKKDA